MQYVVRECPADQREDAGRGAAAASESGAAMSRSPLHFAFDVGQLEEITDPAADPAYGMCGKAGKRFTEVVGRVTCRECRKRIEIIARPLVAHHSGAAMTAHRINVSTTPRGFSIATFTDQYGAACSIQKSSLATEDCVWLGIDSPTVFILASKHPELPSDGTGWIPMELPADASITSRMHLSQDQARGLIELLTMFVATGDIAEHERRKGSKS